MATIEAFAGSLAARPKPPDSAALDFGGRFPFGIDQWAYVPFDVPPGVRRIGVDTSHDRFSVFGVARNVLDLGVFGPAGHELGNAEGFRGWSGGARSGFTISPSDATPGYLPGPVEPGRWALALGPVVLNPAGMKWQARVELEYGAAQPIPSCHSTSTARVPGRPPGWFRGDLHLHTVHSDGRYQPDELAAVAAGAGLDFIVSTEHNTSAANSAWDAYRTDVLLVIAGEEVTTRHGHWLAIGLAPQGWIDWRYAPRDGVFGRFAAEVRAAGGLVVAAHPAVPLPGSAWEFGFGDVDAIEVWNGRWNVDDEVSLRIWHRLIARGRRIAAVGGSDSHGPHQRVGSPQTVVLATDLSTPAVIEGLRRGASYLAESSPVTVELTASCPVGDATLTAGPGETLTVPSGAETGITASVSGAPDTCLALITARGAAARIMVGASGHAQLHWATTDAEARFVRVEIRRRLRDRSPSMVALTNPVWLSSVR